MIAKTIKSSISVNAPRRAGNKEVLCVRVMEAFDTKMTVTVMSATPTEAQTQAVMSDNYK
jgi:hypothetical protein